MKLFYVEIGNGHWLVRADHVARAEELARRGVDVGYNVLGACDYGLEEELSVIQEVRMDGPEEIVEHHAPCWPLEEGSLASGRLKKKNGQ